MLSIQRNTAALSPGKLYKLKIWKKKNKNFFFVQRSNTYIDRQRRTKEKKQKNGPRQKIGWRQTLTERQTDTHTHRICISVTKKLSGAAHLRLWLGSEHDGLFDKIFSCTKLPLAQPIPIESCSVHAWDQRKMMGRESWENKWSAGKKEEDCH